MACLYDQLATFIPVSCLWLSKWAVTVYQNSCMPVSKSVPTDIDRLLEKQDEGNMLGDREEETQQYWISEEKL